MLLNRLVSIAAVFSLVGSALAAPLPRPLEANAPGGLELELEHEDGKHEIEAETHKIVLTEVEIEATDPNPSPKLGFVRRTDSERSMAGSVLAAQKQLDILKPQLGWSIFHCLICVVSNWMLGFRTSDACTAWFHREESRIGAHFC